MKATNIFESLKSKGVCGTDGIAPKLPGMKSPLKKSPYKFNAGLKEAAAEGRLDKNPKFKAAVESSPAKNKYCSSPAKVKDAPGEGKKYSDKYKKGEVKHESITYDPVKKTTTRIFSDADVKKYGIKKKVVSSAKEKTPAKKTSCSSPVKVDLDASKRKPKNVRAANRLARRNRGAERQRARACRRGRGPARRY